MSINIPEALRREVAIRAKYRCEYCRRPELDSFIRYQSDHIISRKHGGKTILYSIGHNFTLGFLWLPEPSLSFLGTLDNLEMIWLIRLTVVLIYRNILLPLDYRSFWIRKTNLNIDRIRLSCF